MILWRHHLNTCQRKIIVFLICLASSEQSEHLTRLSAVRKVLEILGFLELGIFETLGSKISYKTEGLLASASPKKNSKKNKRNKHVINIKTTCLPQIGSTHT